MTGELDCELGTDPIEIVADVVRLARAADKNTTARQIINHVKSLYPEVPNEQIALAIKDAADMLLAQHS